jgi:hypothetical protein
MATRIFLLILARFYLKKVALQIRLNPETTAREPLEATNATRRKPLYF